MATREAPPAAAQVRRLEVLLRSSPLMMAVLRAVRDCDPPEWWVGGGVLRDLVWDRLHRGAFDPAMVKDVDVAFYDPADLRPERDHEVDRLVDKTHAGCDFFSTQVLFEAEPMATVLRAYGTMYRCRVDNEGARVV